MKGTGVAVRCLKGGWGFHEPTVCVYDAFAHSVCSEHIALPGCHCSAATHWDAQQEESTAAMCARCCCVQWQTASQPAPPTASQLLCSLLQVDCFAPYSRRTAWNHSMSRMLAAQTPCYKLKHCPLCLVPSTCSAQSHAERVQSHGKSQWKRYPTPKECCLSEYRCR